MKGRALCYAVLAFLVITVSDLALAAPIPPTQPTTGPGSSDYQFENVSERSVGDGAKQVFIFTPQSAELTALPVVVFFHGYSGTNPRAYEAWIHHTVKRGAIVLYPVYQEGMRGADKYTENAIDGLHLAFDTLGLPAVENVVFYGHSLGCVVASNVAARASAVGLPRARALFLSNAGDSNAKIPFLKPILDPSLESIPSSTLVLAVVGEDDRLAGQKGTAAIFSKLTQISPANKEIVELHTDNHGEPGLTASHNAPLSSDDDSVRGKRRMPNAYDFNGYWKWADALLDASCYGKNREYALGGSEKQLSLGLWSDGVPVTYATRIDLPQVANHEQVLRSGTLRERIKERREARTAARAG